MRGVPPEKKRALSLSPPAPLSSSALFPPSPPLSVVLVAVDLLGYIVVKGALTEEQVRIGNEAIDMLQQRGDLTVRYTQAHSHTRARARTHTHTNNTNTRRRSVHE